MFFDPAPFGSLADLIPLDDSLKGFGVRDADFASVTALLPPPMNDPVWVAAAILWSCRKAFRARYGNLYRHKARVLERQFQTSLVSMALLAPELPRDAKYDLLDRLELGLGEAFVEVKTTVLASIESIVDDGGGPAPLKWGVNPGPAERHLRLRQGNLLFPPHKRTIVPEQIDRASEEDDAALRELVNRFSAAEEQQYAWPHTIPLDDIRRLLNQWDELNEGFLVHGNLEAMRWGYHIAGQREPLLKALAPTDDDGDEAHRTFKVWRDDIRKREEIHHNPSFVTLMAAPEEDYVSTLCSLDLDAIAYVFLSFDNVSQADVLRAACARIFALAVEEGFPAEIAAAWRQATSPSAR